jgi:hypothetical protein
VFALLRAAMRVKGTGAGSRGVGVLVLLVMAAWGLVFASVPAFAAAPERPVNERVEGVTATTATLVGELSPHAAAGEGGEYVFRYRVSESECEGESELGGSALGFQGEEVKEPVTGLQPHATYTFCLVDRDLSGEAKGVHVSFETDPAAPEVAEGSESASSVTGSEATLNATVNANNEPTRYEFEYSTSHTGETLDAPVTTVAGSPPAAPLEGYGGQGVSAATGAVLAAHTTYFYRVVAENAQSEKEGKPAEGKVEQLTTAIPPEGPVTRPVKTFTATTATFEGVLNPGAVGEGGSYEFLYKDVANGAGCKGEDATPGEGAAEGKEVEVKTEVSPATDARLLEPNATYAVCLVAHNNAGEASPLGNEVVFTTPPAGPGIESVATPTVASDHATLEAVVNPENESTTGCVFDYGATTGYGSEVACEPASIGGSAGQPVAAKLAGLSSDTTYYYRLRVSTAAGESEEAGKFVTNSAVAGPPQSDCPNPGHAGLSDRLPDCRAYELMTPVDKGDAEDMFGEGAEPVPTGGDTAEGGYPDEDPAEEGDKFFLYTTAVFGEAPSSGQAGYVFSRTSHGWEATSLAFRNDGPQSIGSNAFFNPDFTDVAFRKAIGSLGNRAVTREGAVFGPPGGPYTEPSLFNNSPFETTNITPVGASTDFSRVFFDSEEHIPGTAATEQLPESNALYEYTEGHYSLVNEKEGKTTSPCGAISPAADTPVSPYNHAVSSDGSRVLFISPDPENEQCYKEHLVNESPPGSPPWGTFTGTPPQLYLRAGGHTIEASAPNTGVADPEGPEPVAYAGASADGSRVFFVTRGELTANDAGNQDPELYEYDVEKPEGERLTRISSGDTHNAVGNVGWVVPSEDGSTVYFTAVGQLAPGAPSLSYEYGGAETGPYNLYRYDTKTATTTYIATVTGRDWFEAEAGGIGSLNIRLPLDVRSDYETTPDGGYLLFASVENITGYDTTDPKHCEGNIGGQAGNGGCAEVYRYDAATGSVVCVSCNPDGALPTANALFDNNQKLHEVRAISDDGAYVFFDTKESLVPAASDEQPNVYEWHEGALSLISSGQDASPSVFLGTDSSGQDVYFGTHSQLVAQDTDSSGDLYDARIDGGFPVSQGSAACEGDACQSPPPAPEEQTPASLTFTGAGNLAAAAPPPAGKTVTKKAAKCKRGFVKKKVKKKETCVKQPKKRSKAKKASHNGRTGR